VELVIPNRSFLALLAAATIACGTTDGAQSATPTTPEPTATVATSGEPHPEGASTPSPPPSEAVVDERPPPMHQPIPLYESGGTTRQIDAATARENGYVVLDLGEEWTPYLFTEHDSAEEPLIPNAYRATYLALARGEFPDDRHGDLAREDQYLEPYGIPPTLALVRTRFHHTHDTACTASLDLEPLRTFEGQLSYESPNAGRNFVRQYQTAERQVNEWMRAQSVTDVGQLDTHRFSDRDERRLAEYQRLRPRYAAMVAVQRRLECEGYFDGLRGGHVEGGFDWNTHEALSRFERYHRIYGWGIVARDTLAMLRRTPEEGAQEAVIRVLTERALHAAGVIEDGSISGTFRGSDGETHDVPNLEAQLRTEMIDAFGLQTPESTLAFLDSLGELPADGEHLVAFRAPAMPEYYSSDMDFEVEIDRGDVWYDFPYGPHGEELPQPVERRPHTTIFVNWNGQRIPLAQFGTTIGGWRSELIDGVTYWRYKSSPPGPVVWHQIVAAPVWLPPESTPVRDLLVRSSARGQHGWAPDYHEVGPSYASAYGLVAAYHMTYFERPDGTIRLGSDEGIRSHGSVDYTSIMRRHSHGCHRLLNHIAVRLMSYVLEHRRHTRDGNQTLGFRRDLERDGFHWTMSLDRGGYVFTLERPIHVEVLPGRIRGELMHPIDTPLPRYDATRGAYVQVDEANPDGIPVTVSRLGVVTPIPGGWAAVVPPDGGVAPGADAGVVQ
jgi:hypothetical protein